MKLDDFLKCKKVRCVDGDAPIITTGKVYDVIGLDKTFIHVTDDNGEEAYYWYSRFEPVLDPAENPLQCVELTPEFDAVEPVIADNCQVNIQDIGTDILDTNADIKDTPKFKVGDKVYAPSVGAKVYTLKDFGYGWVYPIRIDCDYDEDHEFTKEGQITAEGLPILFLATELNHSLLSQLYGIEFERPPASLTGDDLVRAMLKKGIKNVLCLWGNGDKIIIDRLDYKGSLMSTNCHIVGGLTPIDWCTGELLTESVLDE